MQEERRMCGLRKAGSAERRKDAGGPEERRAEKNREKNQKNAGAVAESVRDSENNVFRIRDLG